MIKQIKEFIIIKSVDEERTKWLVWASIVGLIIIGIRILTR